jgi:diaminohydroxyphosphoribosylaminopyrimidine deaminase/5-amino-6-(5-phosphoribosylamino)uracil reductase
MSDDIHHMARALALASRGRGRTSPNPMVGAVVVDDEGVVVGRGAHEFAGGPHAEVHALADAGERARGATLYCTLEPCSHTGRTGPCAPRVVESGIRRVVMCTEDPNPLVAGRGVQHLRSNGIDVTIGVLAEQAEELNRPFFTRMRCGRPLIALKAALSLDARVASARGVRTPLTGPSSNRYIQRERAEVDAIAVGSETVLVDDPLLTARGVYRFRPLTRVVFDRQLRTPPSAQLLSTLSAGPVIIMSTVETAGRAPERVQALEGAGATIVRLEPRDSPTFLEAAARWLGRRECNSLLVEGGPALHAAFWKAGLVDRLELFVTPRVMGSGGPGWDAVPLGAIANLAGASAFPLGDDVVIQGYVHGVD